MIEDWGYFLTEDAYSKSTEDICDISTEDASDISTEGASDISTEDASDISTEDAAKKEEALEQEWQNTWGKDVKLYLQELDKLLAEGSKESRMRAKNLFDNHTFLQHYHKVTEFATLFLIMSIYHLEDEEGRPVTILDQADNVAGLLDCIFQFKTILYRLDFGIGEDAEKELLSFIEKHKVSASWMRIMMNTSVMRPVSTSLKLEKIFENAGLPHLCFCIWSYLDQNFGNCYRIYSKMADFLCKIGLLEIAEDYRKNIPKIPAQFCGLEAFIFDIQELLWRLQHDETAADADIVHYLKQNKIEDDIWEFLVERLETKDMAYYLNLADILLTAREISKARIVLNHALQILPGDELILCLLAELALTYGDMDASAYLSQVANPGELTEKIRHMITAAEEGEQNG